MEKPQSFYIFSDIDGTFMNHNNYCYESIINFVELIKKMRNYFCFIKNIF